MGAELFLAVPMLVLGQVLTALAAWAVHAVHSLSELWAGPAWSDKWEQGLEARLSAALVASASSSRRESSRWPTGSPWRSTLDDRHPHCRLPVAHVSSSNDNNNHNNGVHSSALTDLSFIPVEIQLQILAYVASPLAGKQPTKVLRLSRGHHRVLQRKVYRCVSLRSARAVEKLRVTLVINPALGRLVERIQLVSPLGPLFASSSAPPMGIRAQSRQLALAAVWKALYVLPQLWSTKNESRRSGGDAPDCVDPFTLARHLEQILLATPHVTEVCIDGVQGEALAIAGVWERLSRSSALLPKRLVTEIPVHEFSTTPSHHEPVHHWSLRHGHLPRGLPVGTVLTQPLFDKVEHVEVVTPWLQRAGVDQLLTFLPHAKTLTLHWRPDLTGPTHLARLGFREVLPNGIRGWESNTRVLPWLMNDFVRSLHMLRQTPGGDEDEEAEEDLVHWGSQPAAGTQYDRITILAAPTLVDRLLCSVPGAQSLSQPYGFDRRDSSISSPPLRPGMSSDNERVDVARLTPVFVGVHPSSHGIMRDWFVDRMAQVWM